MPLSRLTRTALAVAAALFVIACSGEKNATADTPKDADPETGATEPSALAAETAASAEERAAQEADSAAALAAANEALAKEKKEAATQFLAENALRDAVTVLPSGLQYEIVETGVEGGDTPVRGEIVELDYTGTLMDGTVFDSSRERGATARFPLEDGLIEGFLEALPLMSEGDRYIFTIPAALAYGETGTPGGPIPPNEALTFDVKLIRVLNAEKNQAIADSFFAENAKAEGVKKTGSGLQYKVINRGDGAIQPRPGDQISVHFRSTLINGTEFNNTYVRGQPLTLPVESEIAGLTEGIQLMSPGDKYAFFIPPALAYGEAGTPRGPIGPNEGLIFEVELLDITSPARNLEKANAFLADNGKKQGVKTTESGLQYKIVKKGPGGTNPVASDRVKVHYKGALIDGTQFDSSYDRGEPATFGLGQVIKAWTEGVQLMTVGDTFEFFVPPALGYGARGTGSGSIGPNEALIFTVELLAVNPDDE
ncbi:MAG: FKBP-type peptidyl-prolyl cis-trans isomerase [Pseudomonadota bacterium]